MPPPLTRSKSPSVNQINQWNIIEDDINTYDSESDGDDVTIINGTSPESTEISSINIILFKFNNFLNNCLELIV